MTTAATLTGTLVALVAAWVALLALGAALRAAVVHTLYLRMRQVVLANVPLIEGWVCVHAPEGQMPEDLSDLVLFEVDWSLADTPTRARPSMNVIHRHLMDPRAIEQLYRIEQMMEAEMAANCAIPARLLALHHVGHRTLTMKRPERRKPVLRLAIEIKMTDRRGSAHERLLAKQRLQRGLDKSRAHAVDRSMSRLHQTKKGAEQM